MINIIDKHNCCGCAACFDACPVQAIAFKNDSEGFWYPDVDLQKCIGCNLCEKVCPFLNQPEPKRPIKVYAAINPDEEVRMKSSSGGIFWMLAKRAIDEGGSVFGAAFDEEWQVCHKSAETLIEVEQFRGSKYVQSCMNGCYKQVQESLIRGKRVLFSGTSCQVAGLNRYLRKEYDNLLSIDVVCHGVPSPMVWKDYLWSIGKPSDINSITMRDKSEGWLQNRITIIGKDFKLSEQVSTNKYMLAFSQDLSIRPSCYNCPAKKGKSTSDITLADFWGVEKILPQMYDGRGTSFVSANTAKGFEALESLPLVKAEADYDACILYNACIERSTKEPSLRAEFWDDYEQNGVETLYSLRPVRASFFKRVLRRLIKK